MNPKKSIYRAIEKLVSEKPLNKITVQNILDEAEISRGTFYKYFHDKYDLANSFYEAHVTNLIAHEYDGNNWKEVLEQIILFIKNNYQYFQQLRKYKLQGSFWAFLKQYSYDFYSSVYASNSPKAELTPGDTYLIWFVTGGCMDVLGTWMDDNCRYPIPELVDIILSLIPEKMYRRNL